MRFLTIAALVALAACSSGTYIVVRAPAPPPPPPRPEPLEITLARPVRGQMLVQTNRPAYVALFEIVPERGVALLTPAHAHQRSWMLAGLNWVPVSWKIQSAIYYGPPSAARNVSARWVYALASDEPLHIPDAAFSPGYMRRVLGPAAYAATNPYATMRAISRAFVPAIIEERWAEDAYVLPATYASDPYRVVRIYCANRTVYEVPDELADRAWCPVHADASGTPTVRPNPTRPDSIVASNGRVRRRVPEPRPARAPVDRVREPQPSQTAPVAVENGASNKPPSKDAQAPKDKEAERRGNGNAYGHTDDPDVKGRGIENEKPADPRRGPRREQTPADKSTADKAARADKDLKPAIEPRPEPGPNEKGTRDDDKLEARQTRPEDKKEDKGDDKVEPRHTRPEDKKENKNDDKKENKQEDRQQQQEAKPQDKAPRKEARDSGRVAAPPRADGPPASPPAPDSTSAPTPRSPDTTSAGTEKKDRKDERRKESDSETKADKKAQKPKL